MAIFPLRVSQHSALDSRPSTLTVVSAHAATPDALQKVEHYLNALTTLKANFTQFGTDGGVAEGTFYLQRPGKMRWQYNPPTPVLMVSDGGSLVYYDSELEQVTYIPLSSTLASFLAQEKISFSAGGVKVVGVESGKGALRISLVQSERPKDGKLTLEFSDNPLQLRNMVITDAQQQMTTVSLSNAQYGEKFDPALFVFKNPNLFKPRRP